MSPSDQKNILFQLSGSIACYKACQLISLLVKKGFKVKTAVSPDALNFIGKSTLEGLTGEPVLTTAFAEGHQMDHIHLARWADLLIVCPATANTINKLAHGISDNVIGALFMSNNFKKPYWIAPAMNHDMFDHPATQESIEKLKSWGVEFQVGEEGHLACGEYGEGRLIEPGILFEKIQEVLK